jgi:hypothetical protein
VREAGRSRYGSVTGELILMVVDDWCTCVRMCVVHQQC